MSKHKKKLWIFIGFFLPCAWFYNNLIDVNRFQIIADDERAPPCAQYLAI